MGRDAKTSIPSSLLDPRLPNVACAGSFLEGDGVGGQVSIP